GEVANALAFVLALALGAKDATASAAASALPTVVGPPIAPPAAPPVGPPATPSVPAEPPKPPLEERGSLWRVGAGAEVGKRGGFGVSTLIGSAFLEGRRVAQAPFGFTFRAGFSSVQTATRPDQNGATASSWWAGNFEACPLRVRVLERLSFLPCVAAEVGRLHVKGRPTSAPGSRDGEATVSWVDGLAGVRLELSLARWLALEVQGDLIVPFTRYRFEFKTDTPAYQVPGLALAGFAGLLAHFP
ncbi:MAG TPA: hypothetical protein VF294_06910, partial [Polyangiaceae bacterium]